MVYDLIIIGGGPAGAAAGIYAARKKLKTALITESFGGQSVVSADIQNWIGTPSISGYDLAMALEKHLRAQEGVVVKDGGLVVKITPQDGGGFLVATAAGESFQTKTVLVTAGSSRRKLAVPGEKEYDGRGVAYCSICDAPLFQDREVAVVGGGNAGLEACLDLFPYARKVYLIHRGENLKGDPVTQEKVVQHSKVTLILNAETQSIEGDEKTVTGLTFRDKRTGTIARLPVQGVFVEIGVRPNSDIVKNLVDLNERGEIKVDHRTQKTSREGIWAAGDVTDALYKQNNTSVGDAIKAVLNIYDLLK